MGGANLDVSITEHRSSRYPSGLFKPESFELNQKSPVFVGYPWLLVFWDTARDTRSWIHCNDSHASVLSPPLERNSFRVEEFKMYCLTIALILRFKPSESGY